MNNRERLGIIVKAIEELEVKPGQEVPLVAVEELCKGEGIGDFDTLIQQLMRAGEIYEPKPGFIRRLSTKKVEERFNKPNFIEVQDVEQANEVNLDIYRFVRYSDSKGVYIFTRRMR